MSEEEFWNLSPGQWMALHSARHESLYFHDSIQARICSTICNTSANKKKGKKFKAEDFLMFKRKKKRRILTAEQLKGKIKSMVPFQR